MGVIAWIILGLLTGWIARAVLPGPDPLGLIATMLIGVAGAIVGGVVAELLGFTGLESFYDLHTWIVAVAGAVALLVVRRSFRGRDSYGTPAAG
jgi:uncharacterized membrane protein YeaQ/YmgE (transglycosylase-associated protein family)